MMSTDGPNGERERSTTNEQDWRLSKPPTMTGNTRLFNATANAEVRGAIHRARAMRRYSEGPNLNGQEVSSERTS